MVNRRHRTQEQLPAGVSLSAKILLCRLAGDEAQVRAFLAARTQRPLDAIHRRVADLLAWYSSKNEAHRVHVAGPSAAPAAARAGAVVDQYLQENNVHEWVTTQNLLKGTTPTTLVVLHRFAGAEPSAASAFQHLHRRARRGQEGDLRKTAGGFTTRSGSSGRESR